MSTINGTLAFFADSEIAFKSKTSSLGFPNDSAKNARVFDFTAFVNSVGLSGSTNVVVIPNKG